MKRYAFVVPRFGAEIVGGAETLVGQLASRLAARGDRVEAWATCARDNRTWENEHAPGVTIEAGVTVRRFPVDDRDLERWVPLQIRISEGMRLSIDEQLDWMVHSVNSRALYEHIAARGRSFDALFFAPYLFGTTFWGSQLLPERSYLIPCLHDEHYAYLDIMQSMFSSAAGALFNAAPEQDLARALYGSIPGGEVGMGFEPPRVETLTPFFEERFPYVVYFGRKETGKNVHVLVDYFVQAKDDGVLPGELRLVIAGGGSFDDLHRPEARIRSDVIDVGYLSELDKRRLVQHSLCCCQPSVNESFSIVLMETWQLGVPVVVHARCAVTRHHVVESGGGLYFADRDEFSAVIAELASNPALAGSMGRAGARYVAERYSWQATIERFDRVMERMGEPRSAAHG